MIKRAVYFSLPLALAAGCSPADMDSDGDLLNDEFEALIGTDPENADTDGDGFDDAVEHFQYFSATDEEDYPYTNKDYPRGPLPDGDAWDAIKDAAEDDIGRGWDVGEFTKSWATEDQHGDPLLLKRFYGEVILLDIGAEWCGPCRAAALEAEEEWQDRHPEGFMFISLLGDGLTDGDSVAERWISWPTGEYDGGRHPYGDPVNYGGDPDAGPLTLAVVEDGPEDDTEQEISRPWLNMTNAFPTFIVIDRNHVIRFVEGGAHQAAIDMVDELLEEDRPEVEWLWPEDVDAVWEALEL